MISQGFVGLWVDGFKRAARAFVEPAAVEGAQAGNDRGRYEGMDKQEAAAFVPACFFHHPGVYGFIQGIEEAVFIRLYGM